MSQRLINCYIVNISMFQPHGSLSTAYKKFCTQLTKAYRADTCPAPVAIESATYLLTISSPDMVACLTN